MNIHHRIFKSILIWVVALLPMTASANYICNCYTDLRSYGQGLVYQGQATSPGLDSSKYYCNAAYRGADVPRCYKDTSYDSAPSTSTSSTQSTSTTTPEKDCIKAPQGIADACIKAFEKEYNPNPGQTELVRDGCIHTAISVAVVNRCLKKFPLHSTKNERATYDRSGCISDLSVDSHRRAFRCPM